MTDYRTPQAELWGGCLAPLPADASYPGIYRAKCEYCGCLEWPLTPHGRYWTRSYPQARAWLKAHGWSDSGPGGFWRCPAHTAPPAPAGQG